MTNINKKDYIALPHDKYGETLHINDWVCFVYGIASQYWHREIRCAKIRSIDFYDDEGDIEVTLSFYESTHDDYISYPEECCLKIVDNNAIKFLEEIHAGAQKEYEEMNIKKGKKLEELGTV